MSGDGEVNCGIEHFHRQIATPRTRRPLAGGTSQRSDGSLRTSYQPASFARAKSSAFRSKPSLVST